jgi:glycosyltransferase involved in cell wall biosynthesis
MVASAVWLWFVLFRDEEIMDNPPSVLLVGGPDFDAYISLMKRLEGFSVAAVGSSQALNQKFLESGFAYYWYPLSRRVDFLSDLSTLLHLTALFRRLSPTIVHTYDTKPGVWGRLAAKIARVPIIVGTLPGLGSLYVNDRLLTRLIRFGYEPLQKLACSYSDLIIFENQDSLRCFVTMGLAPVTKATVIPGGSGVSTTLFDPEMVSPSERARMRKDFGVSQKSILVTMVSRVIRSKGVLDFAEAARIVQGQTNTSFLLVGSSDESSVDKLTPGELSMLDQSVILSGQREDVSRLLGASDIFVFPSFLREGIPRVLLEAASMGLPIVTTNTPGCNSVVEEGVNGFLVPPRDPEALAEAILRLVADPEMRARFGRKSRQLAVSQFDLSLIANQTADLYHMLLEKKGLSPAGRA